jgi:hypothetical protein
MFLEWWVEGPTWQVPLPFKQVLQLREKVGYGSCVRPAEKWAEGKLTTSPQRSWAESQNQLEMDVVNCLAKSQWSKE